MLPASRPAYNVLVRRLITLFLALLTTLSTAQAPPQKPLVPKNKWALVVGASDYSTMGKLRYAAKDAISFHQLLVQSLGFDIEQTRLLADGTSAEPSASNVLSALDQLLKNPRLNKANLFIFYFSGHGMGLPSGDYLCPADSTVEDVERTGVPVKEVIGRIVGAGLRNVLFIADACRSGEEHPFGIELNDLCKRANIAVLLSTAPGKRSYELPRYGHGAFTYSLLSLMNDASVRDEAGGVWASRLGRKVRDMARKLTEPAYGDYAQVPSVFADGSTLDVLLAAYPPADSAALAAIRDRKVELNVADYRNALLTYALELFEQDRFETAVEFFKTADQIEALQAEHLYSLGTSLYMLGRLRESDQIYTRLSASASAYWRDFALATNPSRTVAPSQRVEAGRRLLEGSSYVDRLLGWTAVKSWGSREQRLAAAQVFASRRAPDRRRDLFAQAELAHEEERYAAALKLYGESLAEPGDTPSSYALFMAQLPSAVASGDERQVTKWLEQGTAYGEARAFCHLVLAVRAKKSGDQKRFLEEAKLAASTAEDPGVLFEATKAAGLEVAKIAPTVLEAAARFPFSWKAQIAAIFVRAASKGEAPSLEDIARLDRYIDDELVAKANIFSLFESYLTEAVVAGRMDANQFNVLRDSWFVELNQFNAQFGYEPEFWMQWLQYGLAVERSAQVRQVLLARLKFKPEETPKDLAPIQLLAMMNTGAIEEAERLWKANRFLSTESADPKWFWAAYLAMRGREDEAAQLIVGVAPPSPPLQGVMSALQGYLRVFKSGKPDPYLNAPSDDVVVKALQGMGFARLKNWEQALPLLTAQRTMRVWSYIFIQERALGILREYAVAHRDTKTIEELAFESSISQPANPLFRRYSYLAKPSQKAFANSFHLQCALRDDTDTEYRGRLDLEISPAGILKGTLSSTKASIVFSGAVDASGHLVGVAQIEGKRLRLNATMPSREQWIRMPEFGSTGLLFHMLDDEGNRALMLVRRS